MRRAGRRAMIRARRMPLTATPACVVSGPGSNATACHGHAERRAQERERNFRTSPGIRSLSIHNWRDAMRRFRLFVVGALVLGALVPAVALAASSPTVETGATTNVTTGSAVLTGTVNRTGHRPATHSIRHELRARRGHPGQACRARRQGRRRQAVRRRSDPGHDVLLPARRAQHQGRHERPDPDVQDRRPAAARSRHRHRHRGRLDDRDDQRHDRHQRRGDQWQSSTGRRPATRPTRTI